MRESHRLCKFRRKASMVQTVNIRQFKNNPSGALRMARKAPVVVMSRDQPKAVLIHLDNKGLLREPEVRLALATALYRSECVSLGRGAKIADIPLVDFMQYVSRRKIPVIRGDAKTIREDMKNIEKWRKRC